MTIFVIAKKVDTGEQTHIGRKALINYVEKGRCIDITVYSTVYSNLKVGTSVGLEQQMS